MHRIARPLFAILLAAAAAPALAAGSSQNLAYTPDPALKTASPAELQGRVRDACTAVQARLQNQPVAEMIPGCACYAQRTMKALDAGELDAYRNTGVFNDTARAKALAALDRCKLKRPF